MIHRPSRQHITVSRLCALRCSSHCWRITNLASCGHVTAPLDPLSTWDAHLHVAACAFPHFGTLDPAARFNGALVGLLARQVGRACGARGACGSERSPEARRAAPKSVRPVRRHRGFLFAPPTRPLARTLARTSWSVGTEGSLRGQGRVRGRPRLATPRGPHAPRATTPHTTPAGDTKMVPYGFAQRVATLRKLASTRRFICPLAGSRSIGLPLLVSPRGRPAAPPDPRAGLGRARAYLCRSLPRSALARPGRATRCSIARS